MRALGEGSRLWRVEVVLWAPTPAAERIRELLDAVAEVTTTTDEDDGLRVPDVATATSYDIQPPEPARGVGVGCWVRADTVGVAAETAWRVVETAAEATLGACPPLWDLRLIPREAILSAPSTGTVLTR